MYILKNALKCISRSKGRNILIGIIALVIAVSACVGLSIRQAAERTKTATLDGMSVTATISYDRQSMMNGMGGGKGFDRNQFSSVMGGASSLTLEEYQRYATADSVEDFYYTLTVYLNGSDGFEAVGTGQETDDSENGGTLNGSLEPDTNNENPFGDRGGMMGGMMGGKWGMTNSGDFTVIGYSSEFAMTDFLSGVASVTSGTVFGEGTSDYTCMISEELAVYNDLKVGDTVIITNPSLATETYALTICGIYSSSATNDFSMSIFGAGQDPANRIYMSAVALGNIVDASASASETVTDENTGLTSESAITGTLSATYAFADPDAYYRFEEEVRTLGLDASYTVSSADITAFENSMTPLNTLSTMAGWFLVVILIIGGIVLVVLNIFNVRERKYEIGVLTAMGMKKWKVATQFLCEIFVVTMIAVVIGAGIGAVSSVPVANALLANQIESQQSTQNHVENNFGRGEMTGGNLPGNLSSDMSGNAPGDIGGKQNNKFDTVFAGATNYITEVHSAMNLTVVLQMIGVGLLLTLIAGAASVLFIMRYDPLKILANRD